MKSLIYISKTSVTYLKLSILKIVPPTCACNLNDFVSHVRLTDTLKIANDGQA